MANCLVAAYNYSRNSPSCDALYSNKFLLEVFSVLFLLLFKHELMIIMDSSQRYYIIPLTPFSHHVTPPLTFTKDFVSFNTYKVRKSQASLSNYPYDQVTHNTFPQPPALKSCFILIPKEVLTLILIHLRKLDIWGMCRLIKLALLLLCSLACMGWTLPRSLLSEKGGVVQVLSSFGSGAGSTVIAINFWVSALLSGDILPCVGYSADVVLQKVHLLNVPLPSFQLLTCEPPVKITLDAVHHMMVSASLGSSVTFSPSTKSGLANAEILLSSSLISQWAAIFLVFIASDSSM